MFEDIKLGDRILHRESTWKVINITDTHILFECENNNPNNVKGERLFITKNYQHLFYYVKLRN